MSRPHEAPIRSSGALAVVFLVGACGAKVVAPEAQDGAGDSAASVSPDVGSCPTDIRAPIPTPVCDDARDSSEDKWTAMDAAVWQADAQPHIVLVRVRGGLMPCAGPSEDGAAYDYLLEWNRKSQLCVRAAITSLGGHMHSDDAGQLNAVPAELTWSQIEDVGALRDVIYIKGLGLNNAGLKNIAR